MTMGRPKIEIDMSELKKLCQLQCTLSEIASFFDCSEDTIERRVKEYENCTFAEYFAQNRGSGKISLRRKQYETAMSGNVTMLIWLGKNWLNQVDKQEINQTTESVSIIYNADDGDVETF